MIFKLDYIMNVQYSIFRIKFLKFPAILKYQYITLRKMENYIDLFKIVLYVAEN